MITTLLLSAFDPLTTVDEILDILDENPQIQLPVLPRQLWFRLMGHSIADQYDRFVRLFDHPQIVCSRINMMALVSSPAEHMWALLFGADIIKQSDFIGLTLEQVDRLAKAYAVGRPNVNLDGIELPELREYFAARIRNVELDPDFRAMMTKYLPARYWDNAPERVRERLPRELWGLIANVACDFRLLSGYLRRR